MSHLRCLVTCQSLAKYPCMCDPPSYPFLPPRFCPLLYEISTAVCALNCVKLTVITEHAIWTT